MAKPAYRKAGRSMGILFGSALLGVVGLHATIFFLIDSGLGNQIGGWSIALALVPLCGAVGAGWAIAARVNRRRVQAVAVRLRTQGFRVLEKPTEAERTEFAAPLAHLLTTLGLQRGAVGIQWCAVEEVGPAPARVFEHEYITGSGKTTNEHHHTVIAWPAGHPALRDASLAVAPWFFMAQFGRFLRRGYRDRELKEPEFSEVAEQWTLLGDASTGRRFLNPGVRRAIAASPKTEAWSIGAGWVCCAYDGTFDAENLECFLRHARVVVATGGPS